jgi:eukaryotic-like serine/threonine-protein kinase
MPIQSGTHLGPYEILSAIGAGGMGEVYRAHDPKLGRDVAIKVLPEAFARDAERMARFQREAKVLASLSHPNIATIYGLEDSGSTRALVMELVEGPTLADRIKAGPIPVDEAVRIAKQIADALEYAHERGIIHRDLKPANIKVTNDDALKVLDFGLAKALEGDPSSIDISTSPTISRMATQQGVLLGTAAYMSPEQAKAKTVDRRADIWAFGCVLYEMLTGKVAFPGESVTDTLAGVIRAEPDWSLLPATTPMRVRVLLQRCLQKDPKERLQAIGDARISLNEVLSGAPEGASFFTALGGAAKRWLWALAGLAGVFLLATGLLAFLYFHQKPPAAQVIRFEIPLPEKVNQGGDIALSPDGRKLAFIGTGADGQSRLWVRSIDALDSQPLQGTEGAGGWPFWSPNSRFIAFRIGNSLKKIESSGGPPLTLCDASSVLGGAWTRDDKIVFGSSAGLMQVSASGGAAFPITSGGTAAAPSLLPDVRHFVYLRSAGPGSGSIYVGSVDTKPEQQSSKRLLGDLSIVVYAPSSDPAVGRLLFVRGASVAGATGTLMSQLFDPRRFELIGEAIPIAEQVPNLSFSASATDVLVYLTGSTPLVAAGVRGIIQGQLTWFDRSGKSLGAFGDVGSYRTLALSPDGKRVAFERGDPQKPAVRNVWLYEFARGVTTRFTFSSAWDQYPLWSPDGSRIAFTSNRGGAYDLYQKTSDLAGEDEIMFKSGDTKAATSWSPDGRFLLYFTINQPSRLWSLPLAGSAADRKAVRINNSELNFNEVTGRISPDGRWIAYSSDESGRGEIYVRPFESFAATTTPAGRGTPVTGKWMVSKDGGINPLWRRDGKELFYLSSLGGTAMAVDVSTSGVFQAGVPKTLFKVPAGVLFWDVTSDGKRFLMATPSATSEAAPLKRFTVVLNWPSLLKK